MGYENSSGLLIRLFCRQFELMHPTGAQERELVKKYNDLAARIRDGWPRTAAVLASLAKSYEREAQRHDEEVERLRQGMER